MTSEARLGPLTLATILATKYDLENAGIFSIFLLGTEIWIYPDHSSEVAACRGGSKRTVLRSQKHRTSVYKRRQLNGRRTVCSASWKAGELSAIETAVTVIISDLLTVYVTKYESAVTHITREMMSFLRY
ncbi:hypothetical protein AVEN_52984-1 [Araneus ventricosus]|uniref:Uncharacterized protein n=1 Tax=Araneus ventricosus TaxID=182803 RepID=A0A4Y2WUF4_ARAVE|nr:hypothetical protein AVEN_239440-1 [Araneus ventricosus]GBO40839.1 hypothetical protein AVEN_52984-1 [Araneus ventricosus]